MSKQKQYRNKTLLSKKLHLVVSSYRFRMFNPIATIDSTQTSIIDYLSEATRDGLLISRLIDDNKRLKNELTNGRIDPVVCSPNFYQKVSELHKKKLDRKKKCYGEELMNVALYYFLIGGRKLYETLALNMPLPSMSSVYRFLYDKKSPVEVTFSFLENKKAIQDNGDVNYVWIAEDDTKVSKGIIYNSHEDTVVGLCLPMDPQNGCPRADAFKFTSIQAVMEYLLVHKLSTYAKLITLKPLNQGSKVIILIIYGTNGSDTAELTLSRWKYIMEDLSKLEIHVMGKCYLVSNDWEVRK